MKHKRTLTLAALLLAITLPGASFALCVKADQVNLRFGPGTEHAISWGVPRFMPFIKLGEQGEWTRVEDMEGDKHWIHSSLVNGDMHCAAVMVRAANVRLGPGTDQEKDELSPVEKYYTFEVIKVEDDWVNVQDENFDDAWVAKSLLWIQ